MFLKVLSISMLLMSTSIYADQYVNGYYRSNGTYVQGYHRSSPNNTVNDNYSTKGNVNPYTGAVGTKNVSDYNNSYNNNYNNNSYNNNNSYGYFGRKK